MVLSQGEERYTLRKTIDNKENVGFFNQKVPQKRLMLLKWPSAKTRSKVFHSRHRRSQFILGQAGGGKDTVEKAMAYRKAIDDINGFLKTLAEPPKP